MEHLSIITYYILKGTSITLKLYAFTFILAIPLGMIFAIFRVSRFKILKKIINIYTWIFRGTPLLLQLFFFYYGLGVMGLPLPQFTAAVLTFVLNYASYFTEIFRGGIESIDKGQYEASKVLGMSYPQTMSRIIIPQTIKRVLPATCNEAINLIKDTALVASIGMGDILRAAKEIVTRDADITPFFIAAVIYLMLTLVVVTIFRKLEEKYAYIN